MKFLIVGSGSIGRRHFKNLRSLGFKDVSFYRSRQGLDREQKTFFSKYNPPIFTHLKSALDSGVEAVIISNPTAFHVPIAIEAIKTGAHIFIEKPISNTTENIKLLLELSQKNNSVVYVGYHFRYHPQLQKIKALLNNNALGSVLNARFVTGEYLPDWHPWEDYRQSYAAQKKMGGGVVLTQSHDIDAAMWFFGMPLSIKSEMGTVGSLGIDVEDSAEIILQMQRCPMVSLHLDYLMKPPVKRYEIYAQKGSIIWDYHDRTLRVTDLHGKVNTDLLSVSFNRNDMYVAELRDFLRCIGSNVQPETDGLWGKLVLETILEAKKSSVMVDRA